MANGSFATENTSLILNGRNIQNAIMGDKFELKPVNPLTSQIRGEDTVTIIKRPDAGVYDLTVRLIKQSDDDIFMNTLVNQPIAAVIDGSLQENYANTNTGINSVESWKLKSGSITTLPTRLVNNQDGNVLMEYVIRFNFCVRTI